MPAALRAQERQRGLGDPQRAEQVRLDLVAGVLLGDLLDDAEQAVAGVVDDDVEAPEVLVGLLHRRETAARSVTSNRIGSSASPYCSTKSSSDAVSRAVAATLSPRSSAASPTRVRSRASTGDKPNFFAHAVLQRTRRPAHSRRGRLRQVAFDGVSRATLDKQPHEVAEMFDGVSRRYDLTNTVLSAGLWTWAGAGQTRRTVDAPSVRRLGVLDLAAGTGVSTEELSTTGARGGWLADFSFGMLAAGHKKGARRQLPFIAGDALHLPFADEVVRRRDHLVRSAQRRRRRRPGPA